MPSEASATSTVFGYSFQDIITCDHQFVPQNWVYHLDPPIALFYRLLKSAECLPKVLVLVCLGKHEKMLEIRTKCVKWIKHIDFEILSRKEDEDEELQRVERETLWDAMARGERAYAMDRVMAEAWGSRDKDNDVGHDGEPATYPYVGPSPSDVGGQDMDPGGLEGGVHANDTHDKDMDPGGGDRGLDAEDTHDQDMDPGGGQGSAHADDTDDQDMDPASVEGGVQGDASVKDSRPGSEASHLSGQSLDVCGDCGLIPCMCEPTPQVIPESAREIVAEAEARAKAEFKARDELEHRPYYTMRCPACGMKHIWREWEEPWGTCDCGAPMSMMPRDESASTSTSEVCVCVVCSVWERQGTRVQNAGTPVPGVVERSEQPRTSGYKTRVHPGTCSLLHRTPPSPRSVAPRHTCGGSSLRPGRPLSLPPTSAHHPHRRPGIRCCPKTKPRAAVCDRFVSGVVCGRGEQAGTQVQNAGTCVPAVLERCQRRRTSGYKKWVHEGTHAPCCTGRKKKKKKKGTGCRTGTVRAVGGDNASVQCVVRMEKSCGASACQAKCAKSQCLTLTHFSLPWYCVSPRLWGL